VKIKDIAFYNRIRDFLDVYIVKQKKYSKNTQKSYRETINLLLDFFEETLGLTDEQVGFEDMTISNLNSFLQWLETERGCSDATLNQRLMAVRSFMKYCAALDPAKIALRSEIQSVPTRKTPPKVVEFLTAPAMKALLEQIDDKTAIGFRDKTFILLMYDLGARCQEMLDLKLNSLDLRKNEPQVNVCGKGGKVRPLPISDEIVLQLNKYLEVFHPVATRSSDDQLFYTVIHEIRHKMSPDTVALFFRKYSAKGHEVCAELPERVRPHQIRHSRAMHLYRTGMPQVLLSEFLGHADPITTKVYAWSDTEMKRDAIEKANPLPLTSHENEEVAIWKGNRSVIRKLYGLG
jgi:site-specific recombinase XerD